MKYTKPVSYNSNRSKKSKKSKISKISKKSKKSKKSKTGKLSKNTKNKKSLKSLKNKKSLIKSLNKSKCNKTKKVNFNLVLDLDNTIISSLTKDEFENRKIDNKVKFQPVCNGLYYTMERPYLNEFLNYIFPRFHVSVWTAASKDYAQEIIEKFIIKGKKNRKLRGFLYNSHCKESMDLINPKTMKDLRYLYVSKNKLFNPNNTVIIDDLKEVLNNNKKNSIDSEYFDSSKKNALNDTFLLQLMKDLDIVYKTLCKIN
jgi:hypothetical protein